MAKKETNVPEQKPEEELSYAEILRRREDEDRYLAEQRANQEEKTGCLGISATFLVGTFCILFLITGLGFFGYGIYCFIQGEYDVSKRIIMTKITRLNSESYIIEVHILWFCMIILVL